VNSKHSGFTLIELMITLAVLAILVALAAPSFSDILDRRKLNGASEELFSTLVFAKTETIKRNTPVHISFAGTGATWCYGLSVNSSCDCSDNAPACTIDGVTKIISQVDYSGVSVDAASSTLDDNSTSFNPRRGAAATSGTLTFSIPSGDEISVELSTVGRVKLCSAEGTSGHSSC